MTRRCASTLRRELRGGPFLLGRGGDAHNPRLSVRTARRDGESWRSVVVASREAVEERRRVAWQQGAEEVC